MRVISFCLVLLATLVACSGTPTAQPSSDASTADTTNAPAETTAPRTITHALGETAVPANPQRIAVVGYNEVEELMALGITPIAVLYPPPPFLPPEAQEIPLIGNDAGQPNLERLLALKPDLILGVDWAMSEIYDELSQIAPSVAVPRPTFAAWKEALRFTADVVGRSEQAEELLAAYDQRVAEVRTAIGEERLANTEVTAFRPYTDGSGFLIWIDRSFCDVIMAEVGIRRPEAQRAELPGGEERIDNLSLEKIPLLDADVIFLALPESGTFERSTNEGLDQWLTAIETSPLWTQLRAVQNNQVYKVDTSVWNEGSVLAAMALLDDLEQYLGTPSGSSMPDTTALQVLKTTGEYRLIKHSLGETRVPLQPQRVVTLQDQNALLPLFELGFTDVVGSVGAVRADGSTFYRRMQDYDTSGVTYVGEYGTPNLEQIAALRPDLIVGSQYEVTEENYDLLSQIAPTVAVEQFTRPIWDSHADLALLVNRQEEAAALKARYDARVAELRAAIPDPSTVTVSLINTWEGQISVEASPYVSYITVFNDIGFDLTEPQRQALKTGEWTQYSVERLTDFDADVIFVPIFGQRSTENEFLTESPLWQQLNAVQKGQAQEVSGEEWFGMAYQALFNVLDGIERYVIQAEFDSSWEPQ